MYLPRIAEEPIRQNPILHLGRKAFAGQRLLLTLEMPQYLDLSLDSLQAAMAIPILDLEHSQDPNRRLSLLHQLRDALFNIGFLYIRNHSVPEPIISDLVRRIPGLFDLSEHSKSKLSKINSPHFLGYSGLAQETTQGKQDLREQFDFATELPAVDDGNEGQNTSTRDLSRPYWRLQGPNLWPEEDDLPGFKNALIKSERTRISFT